jgi:T6SS, Phospholipase effector Tle1-like, catalytic domain
MRFSLAPGTFIPHFHLFCRGSQSLNGYRGLATTCPGRGLRYPLAFDRGRYSAAYGGKAPSSEIPRPQQFHCNPQKQLSRVNWFTLAPNSQRVLFAHSMLPLGGRSGNVPKNLVLCCDGTANEFAQDRTNVVKLFFTLARDPHRQVTYHHYSTEVSDPRVGLPNQRRLQETLTARWNTRVLGVPTNSSVAHACSVMSIKDGAGKCGKYFGQ